MTKMEAQEILDWVVNHFSVCNVYTDDEICDYVQGKLSPWDVFSQRELEDWARNNGWKEE